MGKDLRGLDDPVDVIVVGSGAGGLATAVAAATMGLSVRVLEKEAFFGGTTAYSGGVLWIPCHRKLPSVKDSTEAARTYMLQEAGDNFDPARVDAFLKTGPEMIEFFERNSSLKFVSVPEFSDYHPTAPGAVPGGRSLLAAPYDARELGQLAARLRPPLKEITFVGMMFNASKEVSHFFNCTRSLSSAAYVVRRLTTHALEMIRYGRAQRLTNGNALIARLARSAYDKMVEIRTEMPVSGLIIEQNSVGKTTVKGVEVSVEGKSRLQLYARKAVVLASGGFPQDPVLKQRLFEHAPTGHEHVSPAPAGNTGDGWRLAESAGGLTCETLPNNAAWIPVSRVPRGDGSWGVFPHLVDRYKPGIIAVLADGRRFVNEADSYHDFGCALRQACERRVCEAWLICDHKTINRYGLGYAKPFPVPKGRLIKSGYLIRAKTIRALASQAGIDPQGLLETVALVNRDAATGVDTQFGKGSTAYNRFLGDPSCSPNPCFAGIEKGPFYAVKVVMGDLGTFAGVRTDHNGQVIGSDGDVIPGLYCVGNDALSVMGGAYPGGGITLGPAMTFGYRAAQSISTHEQVS